MSTIASHSPSKFEYISTQTVRYRGFVPIGNGLWWIEWSRDRWRHI